MMKPFPRKIFLYSALLFLVSRLLTGCMEWDYGHESETFDFAPGGLYILNEGNFQYGNATLSHYNPSTRTVENELFFRANDMKLGDVAQSMTLHDGQAWIVVNNSHVVFAIDPRTCRETGRIGGLTSPRYIHFVSDEKAYVTQIWDNRIFIVNPRRYEVTGTIEVPDMAMGTGSTEQMVQLGRYVFCTCWSYQNRVIRIDTTTDLVDASRQVGLQPNSMVLDREGRMWVLCDGGYDGSPAGNEPPSLWVIDADSFTVERIYRFKDGDTPSELQINGSRDAIYWLNDGVWKLNITDLQLPQTPVIPSRDTKYYGLTIDPAGGDIYVGDAIDYQQPGLIYRYNSAGQLIDSFRVGISPGAYCWH